MATFDAFLYVIVTLGCEDLNIETPVVLLFYFIYLFVFFHLFILVGG